VIGVGCRVAGKQLEAAWAGSQSPTWLECCIVM
jgi:hypothetical protein